MLFSFIDHIVRLTFKSLCYEVDSIILYNLCESINDRKFEAAARCIGNKSRTSRTFHQIRLRAGRKDCGMVGPKCEDAFVSCV